MKNRIPDCESQIMYNQKQREPQVFKPCILFPTHTYKHTHTRVTRHFCKQDTGVRKSIKVIDSFF